MAILIDRETKLITVGFTGKEATFHSLQAKDYGTAFVGGVTPGKGGTVHAGFPVFNTVHEAAQKIDFNTAMVFVPPDKACDSLLECIDAKVSLIVCITEGIPWIDMLKVRNALKGTNSTLVGPNCPGVINPGEAKVGVMPGHIFMPGELGIISRSGTLLYEIVSELTNREIGQSTCVGIGGDAIVGSNFIDILKMFESDPNTKAVALIGEIGGYFENDAALWIKKNMRKPVMAYVAGATSPRDKTMGHSGAIIKRIEESSEKKYELFEECSIITVYQLDKFYNKVKEVIQKIN